jgi:carbohydrate binding protein with CBM4/9 domain
MAVSVPVTCGHLHLPKTLAPGRYYVFFRGTAYDSNLSVQAKIGAAVSTSVVADDRDANGDWTDRAVIDVTASSSDVVVNIIRNPAVAVDQKYLFRGIYITTNDKESVDRYSTALKLIYPTVMDDSAAVKGNLINDSGFETGIDASWGFDGRRTEPPIWDNTQAYEGRSSMKVSLDHYANAYGDNMGLVSRIYHLKPNKKYTVSMWAKTSPGQTVAIRLDLTNTFTPPAGYPTQPVVGSFIYATDTWQRISATGYALQYPTSDYQIHLMSNELSGGYLWIDGVQLEEGDISNYQPASPVVAGVMINDQPGNVFYEDEAIAGDLLVRNNLTTQAAPIVRYEIYDFMNQLVRRGSEDFTLPAQTTQQVAFSLSTGKRGIFRIVTWVDGMEHTSKEISYSVIPRPAVTGLDPDSFLGVHPNYTESELSILEKLGIKWARALSPSGFYRWSVIEPVEGQFYWYDADIQRAAAHGITTLGTIGTNNYWPGWADNGGLPDLAKWQTFVGQLAEHYRDSVQYWEIWNEPHSVFTADFYAQMLKLAVDAIEVNNPNAKIVGMGGVPLSYMNAVIAAMQSRYPTWDWKQHIHVLSTHNYPDGEPPESFKPNITDNYGIPVWNTESGSWDRGFYQGPNSNFTAWGKNLWPYADASRYY